MNKLTQVKKYAKRKITVVSGAFTVKKTNKIMTF